MNVTATGATWERPPGADDHDVRRPGPWTRSRGTLVDTLLVTAVFAYTAPVVPAYADSASNTVALLAVSAVLCASYLGRRRHPTGVLAVMLRAVPRCAARLLESPHAGGTNRV